VNCVINWFRDKWGSIRRIQAMILKTAVGREEDVHKKAARRLLLTSI